MGNPKKTEAARKLADEKDPTIHLEDLSDQQRAAINNFRDGQCWYRALIDAGYADSYAEHPSKFKNYPAVKAYFEGTSGMFKERYLNEAAERAGQRMIDALGRDSVDGGLVALIRTALKFSGIEPKEQKEIIQKFEGGSNTDLSKIYDVVDDETARDIISSLQEEEDGGN